MLRSGHEIRIMQSKKRVFLVRVQLPVGFLLRELMPVALILCINGQAQERHGAEPITVVARTLQLEWRSGCAGSGSQVGFGGMGIYKVHYLWRHKTKVILIYIYMCAFIF